MLVKAFPLLMCVALTTHMLDVVQWLEVMWWLRYCRMGS